jgi:multidrug efflux pump subunit AcrB
MAMAIVLLGIVAILRMPTDIFPEVDIPVISVIWQYPGMSPDEMEGRIVRNYEGICTTTVNNIEHIESQALNGVSVTRLYFQPGAKIEEAEAQVAAISQTALRQMPPGIQPPLIMRYSASTVPILQLSLQSDTLPEQQLFDISAQFLRTELATVQGAMIPYPYGGKQRQVMVDLEPDKLFSFGLSAADVTSALVQQNLILPSGTAKIGSQEYYIRLNSSPELIEGMNDLPIKTVNGTVVYIKDVAHVSDKYLPQTNLVHAEGQKGALVWIYKLGNASTLDIVRRVRDALPKIYPRLPHYKELAIIPLFDQSVFVRASVTGVVKEAIIAAALTGLMILLFLGSWRSTLIICISIPLSILVSIIILWLLGQTLNVMTLGGMALAVGILVDDATVEIENIHRNLHQRKRLVQAILDGARQIAVPAFVSTLCICIVFVPVIFITGPAKSLFTPLAMAVVFAMLTSYLLSRTLVPTMVHFLLESEVSLYGGKEEHGHAHWHAEHSRHAGPVRSLAWAIKIWGLLAVAAVVVGGLLWNMSPAWKEAATGTLPQWANPLALIDAFHAGPVRVSVDVARVVIFGIVLTALVYYALQNNWIWRTHEAFNRLFERFRRFYGGFLVLALRFRGITTAIFVLFVIGSFFLYPFVGRDFFPTVDAGQLRLHVRAPAGTRLEESERYFAKVEEYIRKEVIPPSEITTMLDNIGIPNSGINLSLSDGSQISPADGEILIALKEDHHPTAGYMKKLREQLPERFPGVMFYFAPGDIATQVLNFGLPAPIDVQILGPKSNNDKDLQIAEDLRRQISGVPGAVDVHIHQVAKTPDIRVTVDRAKADQMGLSQQTVANSLLVSLASSGLTSPSYWLDPKRGVQYSVAVMTPQYKIDSMNALENTPIITPGVQDPQLLGNLAGTERGVSPSNVTHYNIQPTFDVQCNVQGSDLGSVSDHIQQIVDKVEHQKNRDGSEYLPPGSNIVIRGQSDSMNSSFQGLAVGIIGAVILVYLLMVVNFQSWLDPLIILMALPSAAGGILWMLYASRTTLSVPSLMGSIMCIGVATANSILMITFANDQRKEHGMNARDAALAAGLTRLRPVVMTALAMIIGMLPMSLGLGEGGEQNAPLGRAVIGGLSAATFATLFFVPVVYSALRTKDPHRVVEPELQEVEA